MTERAGNKHPHAEVLHITLRPRSPFGITCADQKKKKIAPDARILSSQIETDEDTVRSPLSYSGGALFGWTVPAAKAFRLPETWNQRQNKRYSGLRD